MEQLSGSASRSWLLLAGLGAAWLACGADAAARRAPAKAPKPPGCPGAGSRAVSFAKAIDGATFVTADGTEVRLAGVLALGSGGETVASSGSEAARQALVRVLQSGPVMLAAESAPDRYGRIPAEVFAGGTWVQAALLRAGELRASPDRSSAPCAKELMAGEDEARVDRAGRWREGVYALRTPEQLRNRTGTFQIVEGTVQTSTVYKGRAYINFGADYRTDFTVTVSPEDMKLFRQARFDVRKLAGQRVRVRGWIEFYNGPEMIIAHPAVIETIH